MQLRIVLAGLILLFTTYLWVGHPLSEQWPERLTDMIRHSLYFLQQYKHMALGAAIVAVVSLFLTYQKP